ncbi:MAG: hypothetical protein COY58_03185 [Gammaproteobacteria bacterium CG_4_10_14_0_8_um_filter_38_16]|nr:MAG: hypothetical protein COY58_03185 [Gammaproteobacteria bacterium CG_4_10_14_0_8_um_filter_38_16]PJA03930.1 MAG: hypothetical protein COX72_03345 [Gammaproteobacteria bacterium CG_4_10_14_0_2_um_filter_38_22]PJB09743.1 MAG: hypothetical protein CO120_08545 [Gammaproteobacteria bacterium CG_4_9_14_3_um_filter_38_9]
MKPFILQPHIPDALLTQTDRDWLTNTESLTRRLREFTNNEITHHLFLNEWGYANAAAIAALNIHADTKTWLRRMEWRYEKETWVTCTVVIPETSIYDNNLELLSIGKNSIGDILFQDKTLTRSHFVFTQHENKTWSRESLFYYKQKPIYLIETFSTDFFRAIGCASKNIVS